MSGQLIPRPSIGADIQAQRQLPRIPKRTRPITEGSEVQNWGGGADLAPTRRQRGQWIPPKRSRRTIPDDTGHLPERSTAINTSFAHRSRVPNDRNQQYDPDNERTTPGPLRLAVRSGPLPLVDEGSDVSVESLSDKPRQVTPPPGLSWQSATQNSPLDAAGAFGQVSAENMQNADNQYDALRLSSNREPKRPRLGGQLPDDHPLKVHLAKLQREREKRKLQWAGLIDSLGDEFRNPASHDRFLWLQEEQKADDAIAETMLQIKMAESGLPPGLSTPSPSSRPEQSSHRTGQPGRGRDGRLRPVYGHRGNRGGVNGRPGRGRPKLYRGRSNEIPLHKQDIHGNLHPNFRARKKNAPSKMPMRWDEQRKDDAVRSWLKDMGMSMPEGSAQVSADGQSPSGYVSAQEPDAPSDDAMSFTSIGASGKPGTEFDGGERGVMTDDMQIEEQLQNDMTTYGVSSPRALSDEVDDRPDTDFEAAEAAREQERYEAAIALERHGSTLEQPLSRPTRDLNVHQPLHDLDDDEHIVIKEETDDDDESIRVYGVDGFRAAASPPRQTTQAAAEALVERSDVQIRSQDSPQHQFCNPRAGPPIGEDEYQLLSVKHEPLDIPNHLYDDIYGCDDEGRNEARRDNHSPRATSAGAFEGQHYPGSGKATDADSEYMKLEDSSDDDYVGNLLRSLLPPHPNMAPASAGGTGGATVTPTAAGTGATEAEAMRQLAEADRLDLSAMEQSYSYGLHRGVQQSPQTPRIEVEEHALRNVPAADSDPDDSERDASLNHMRHIRISAPLSKQSPSPWHHLLIKEDQEGHEPQLHNGEQHGHRDDAGDIIQSFENQAATSDEDLNDEEHTNELNDPASDQLTQDLIWTVVRDLTASPPPPLSPKPLTP